jgi:hypothetical protein
MTTKLHVPKYGDPLEHAIVRLLVDELHKAGWLAKETYDGEEYVLTRTMKAVLDTVFGVEEATIFFVNATKNIQGVKIVRGSGDSIISDYHSTHKNFADTVAQVLDIISEGYTIAFNGAP